RCQDSSHKERGGVRFRGGDVWGAADSYSRALKLLIPLSLQLPSRDELKIIKASAAKATKLEPGASKAWYRLGQACQMLNELEEAKQAFRKLLELQPDLPAAVKALKDVIHKEKQRNAQLGQRLSKIPTQFTEILCNSFTGFERIISCRRKIQDCLLYRSRDKLKHGTLHSQGRFFVIRTTNQMSAFIELPVHAVCRAHLIGCSFRIMAVVFGSYQ
uniref:Uncharacterized protein n=1 Tax=Kryptolebias marmoratus TaxID=37003 RepID=A0A3Q3GXL2_KRYMA